jgi:hypothetical protein
LERVSLASNNKKQFLDAIDAVSGTSQGSPIGEATIEAVRALDQQYEHQRNSGEYRLVIVTSGTLEPGERETLAESIELMQKRKAPIKLYTIVYGEEVPNHPLQQISTQFTVASTSDQVEDALIQATTGL